MNSLVLVVRCLVVCCALCAFTAGAEQPNVVVFLADDAGYATGAFGKWHNGTQYPYHPRGRGFDEYFGHTAGHWGVPFTTPHSPWAVPDDDWQRFKDKPITQRATLPQQEDLAHTRCALAMVENQDDNVGRVLKKLDELQLTNNTIIVYFSDNGPNSWRWNDGMKGRKGSTDEGGVRSVCYLRWPAASACARKPIGLITKATCLT